jgi:hypothetical protein
MRDRGTYGPLDHDRHFVIGWGADQLTSYARDRAVSAALEPVLPTISAVARGARGIDRLRMGMQVGGRDEAQKPPSVVGQEFFHTVADRARALAMLSTYWKAFVNDLTVWQEANKSSPEANITAQWFEADVTTTLEEWRRFVENQESWWSRAATSWETYEEWWQRIKQMRALARAHGISLQSAELVPLPKTIWQRSAEGNGSEATALLGILKVGVFTVLTITGAVSFYAMVRDLRPRKIT